MGGGFALYSEVMPAGGRPCVTITPITPTTSVGKYAKTLLQQGGRLLSNRPVAQDVQLLAFEADHQDPGPNSQQKACAKLRLSLKVKMTRRRPHHHGMEDKAHDDHRVDEAHGHRVDQDLAAARQKHLCNYPKPKPKKKRGEKTASFGLGCSIPGPITDGVLFFAKAKPRQ